MLAPRALLGDHRGVDGDCLLPETLYGRRLVLGGLAGLLACVPFGVAGQSGAGPRVRAAISSRGLAAIRRAQPRVEYGLNERGLRLGAPLYLRVRKREAVLETWLEREPGGRYGPGRTYRLCGSGTTRLGHHRARDDGRVPEGFYRISPAGLEERGAGSLATRIDWPNAHDRALLRRPDPAALLIGGGCRPAPGLGLTDTDFEELFTLLYAALAFGQRFVPLHIFPHALGPLERIGLPDTEDGRHWRALAPAWQAFGRNGKPPQTSVRGGLYVISD